MTPVFADTAYFIGLINPSDSVHTLAIEFSKLIDRMVTTEWVLLEFADGICDSINRKHLNGIRAALISNPLVELIPLEMQLHQRAIDLYTSRPDKEWSLTDCVSFVVMTDRKLTEALTTDHHFEQAGFKALLKPS